MYRLIVVCGALTAVLAVTGRPIHAQPNPARNAYFGETRIQTNVWHIGTNATLPSNTGNVAQSGSQGVTSPYKIEDGKVVTTLSQEPYAVTVYKLGDTYYGSRSNEFGYANCEFLPKPPLFLNPLGKGEAAEEEKPIPPGPGHTEPHCT